MLVDLKKDLKKISDPEKGKFLQRFFKTGEGEYAEGDIFIGITVPQSRIIAKRYDRLSIHDIELLLHSKIHEERLIALFILVDQFAKGNELKQKEIYNFYLANTAYINNWDLVDSSADKIVGGYLFHYLSSRSASWRSGDPGFEIASSVAIGEPPRNDTLGQLAKSKNIWERRIAMIATYHFIQHGAYEETFRIGEMLLHDKHDLIHKAVGWMLREVGKHCSQETEEVFLKKYYKEMPRTMLRYAIEHFTEEKRKYYLKK